MTRSGPRRAVGARELTQARLGGVAEVALTVEPAGKSRLTGQDARLKKRYVLT